MHLGNLNLRLSLKSEAEVQTTNDELAAEMTYRFYYLDGTKRDQKSAVWIKVS